MRDTIIARFEPTQSELKTLRQIQGEFAKKGKPINDSKLFELLIMHLRRRGYLTDVLDRMYTSALLEDFAELDPESEPVKPRLAENLIGESW